MTTKWFQRKAGELEPGVYDVTDELGEPALMLANHPDWVMRPDTGQKLRVMKAVTRRMACPVCHAEVTGRVLVLDADIECIEVMECPHCKKFVFYRRKGE